MPKPITIEMIDAMSPTERKNLHGNALGRDTPAAKAVLELLAQSDPKDTPPAVAKVKRPSTKSVSKAKTE